MKKLLALVVITGVAFACVPDDEPTVEVGSETVDQGVLLAHWADHIILPAYRNYAEAVTALRGAAAAFDQAPDVTALSALRTAWREAYRAWQWVSMYEIGPAEAASLRNFTNIYPTDAAAIEQNVADRNYAFDLPSKYDEQGFPALDYLLYGLADTDDALLARYTDAERGERYRAYLLAVVNRLDELTTPVVDEWSASYRDAFVSNTGTSATASFNALVNDYLFYYEKALRAGKVGIPRGWFSSTPLPETVEGYYVGDISQELLLEALRATQSFFNGQAFGSDKPQLGLSAYLDQVETTPEGEPLSARINEQFDLSREAAQQLQPGFAQQIADDNQAMLTTFDALQRNVVLMKVDMFQALNVKVDFVDADGD